MRAWAVLGELRELSGLLAESVDAYRRAGELAASDPVSQAELLIRRARVHERAGAYVTALRMVGRARRLLEGLDGDPAMRARVRLDNLTAIVRLGQERPRDARRWASLAAEGARATHDPETLVQALMAIDHADLYLGMHVEGVHTREALDICVAEGFRPRESIARTNLGNFAFFAGRWDEALDWYESSRRVALEAGNAFGAAETDVSRGDILVSRGQLDEAEAVLRDAIRVLRVSGMDFEATYGDMQIARISLARGELVDAEARITAVVAEFMSHGHRMTALEASLIRADIAIGAGEDGRALAIVDEAEASAKDEAAPLRARSCLQRARALLALGQLDRCEQSLRSGLQAAREQELPYEEALLLRVRAEFHQRRGDLDLAASDADKADALLTRLGARA